jgi:hypothetical protein
MPAIVLFLAAYACHVLGGSFKKRDKLNFILESFLQQMTIVVALLLSLD